MNPSGKQIQGVELNFSHVGTRVTFIPLTPRAGDLATGRIKFWDDSGVVVDYVNVSLKRPFSDLIFEVEEDM